MTTRTSHFDSRQRDLLAVAGLIVSTVFGVTGGLLEQPKWQQVAWTIDGAGLVVATTLLAARYLRRSEDVVAAGFLIFGIGECLLLSGTAAGLVAGVPSYAGGVALWAAALLLISVPRVLPGWVRIAGAIAAALFAIAALRIELGEPLLRTTRPLPFLAYPFLGLTFFGWILTLLRNE